jgi:hypothetical protein
MYSGSYLTQVVQLLQIYLSDEAKSAGASPVFHLRMEAYPVSEMLISFLEYEMINKVKKPNNPTNIKPNKRKMPRHTANPCHFTSSFPSRFSMAASLLVSCSLSSSFGFSSWFSSLLGLPRREPKKQRTLQLQLAISSQMERQ